MLLPRVSTPLLSSPNRFPQNSILHKLSNWLNVASKSLQASCCERQLATA